MCVRLEFCQNHYRLRLANIKVKQNFIGIVRQTLKKTLAKLTVKYPLIRTEALTFSHSTRAEYAGEQLDFG